MTKSQKQIGAQLERNAIRKKVKEMIAKWDTFTSAKMELNDLLEWINSRHKRYNKRKGGLGK